MIQITILEAILFTAGFATIQFLVANWLKTRLAESIRAEYATLLEKYKYELKVREQAAKIAELFAEARDGDVSIDYKKAKRINRLAWELSLWLPADTVRELTSHLCGTAGSKQMKEILIAVRKHILMDPQDDLLPEQIVHFDWKK